MATAQQLLASGDPQGALALLQAQVRGAAGDVKLRVFLAQLLCVLGQWERALTQFQVCGEMDAATLPMTVTYGAAVTCEMAREAVFAGGRAPLTLGAPPAWMEGLTEALQAEGRGDAAGGSRLRSDALERAPASPGHLNGMPFDWIADADSRLGPVIEAVIDGEYHWVPYAAVSRLVIDAPVDLRDLVWAPARIQLLGGAERAALLPARYPGSGASGDGALQLARRTEWFDLGPDQIRGLGQRLVTSSGPEAGLLEVREIVLAATGPTDAGGMPA